MFQFVVGCGITIHVSLCLPNLLTTYSDKKDKLGYEIVSNVFENVIGNFVSLMQTDNLCKWYICKWTKWFFFFSFYGKNLTRNDKKKYLMGNFLTYTLTKALLFFTNSSEIEWFISTWKTGHFSLNRPAWRITLSFINFHKNYFHIFFFLYLSTFNSTE